MAFRLQTLLDLKKRAEDEAEEAMAKAIAERVKVEQRQATLDAAVVQAKQKLAEAIALGSEGAKDTDEILARDHYRKRLRANVELRKQEAEAHRTGPLAAAKQAEADARAKHLALRQEREALEKFKEKELAKERLIADRRTEDALGDLAIAAIARKPRS